MKCGNCNIDFKSKKQGVRHMLEVHESAFVDGSEDLQKIQEELASENKEYSTIIEKSRLEE